jgi:methionyl-tRNA formyltransferase
MPPKPWRRGTRNDGSSGIITIDKSAKSVFVQTQDGILELLQVQMEGKREMSSFEFATGQRIKPGESFES